MTGRAALRDCYRSGQMSEAQWQEHVAEDHLLECQHPVTRSDGQRTECVECGEVLS